jgi:hypothetical protein
MLPALRLWTGDDLPVLADLGYEGEASILVLPCKAAAAVPEQPPVRVMAVLVARHQRETSPTLSQMAAVISWCRYDR